jgi:four helix bundle protein
MRDGHGDKETRRQGDKEKRKGAVVAEKIQSVRELRVWQRAMDLGMRIFELSKRFPAEERYSLTDQVRRSSRSVAANIAEAWRKRRYEAAFVSKLNDAEGEAAETQTHLEFARRCGYLTDGEVIELDQEYEGLLGQLVYMTTHSEQWILGGARE